MTRFLIQSLLLSTSVCPSTLEAKNPRVDWLARYQVTLDQTETGVPSAIVWMTLEWIGRPVPFSRPESVVLSMADDGFPKGYGTFVSKPWAMPEMCQSITIEALSVPAGTYRLSPPYTPTPLLYTVVLEHDPEGWGPGPDEAPYRFEGGAFWTGRALFMTVPNSRAEVTFQAPEGQRVSVSFEPIAGRPGSYSVPSETRLRDSFLIVGDYEEARLKVGDAAVILALGGGLKDSMPAVEPAIRRFLEASGGVFGGAPPARSLIVGNLGAPPGSLYGGGFADDLSLMADAPLGPGNADRWRPLLCHEIFHLWNGNAIPFGRRQQYWFSEGVTEYYAHLLPVRLGEASEAGFLETVRRKAEAYLEAAGPVGLLEAGDEKFLNQALVYDGGALAALSLDLRIRAATANRKSLDDVLKSLYEKTRHLKGKGVTFEQISRTVSEVAGRPMRGFLDRFVEGRNELPLAESLALAGIRFQAEISELPGRDVILQRLLLLSSVSGSPEGLKVHRSESEAIRPGDVIVEVGGSPVRTFDDLRLAFRDRTPGSTCAVGVVRDGRRETVEVVLGGRAEDPLPRSRYVAVTVETDPDADPQAGEIRRSLLGRTQEREAVDR